MNKTVYLAGKVSGLPTEQVERKFQIKQQELTDKGYDVINPFELVRQFGAQDESWLYIMRICIPAMVVCDEVHMLPCWQSSPGARLERDTAMRLGIPVVYH